MVKVVLLLIRRNEKLQSSKSSSALAPGFAGSNRLDSVSVLKLLLINCSFKICMYSEIVGNAITCLENNALGPTHVLLSSC